MINLKLNALESRELENLKGGRKCSGPTMCGCSCYYSDNGGSSVEGNGKGNADCGQYSAKGDIVYIGGYDAEGRYHGNLPLCW